MIGYLILYIYVYICTKIKNRESALNLCFLGITLFSAIRYGIGYDYYGYYESVLNYDIGWADRFELIPRYIAMISYKIYPYLFFILTSIFISFFYYWGIKKESSDYFVSIIFYLTFPFLFMDQLGVVRQGMATALIFCAATVFYKHYFKQILCIFIAILCHQSALIGILLVLPWWRLGKKVLWVLFIFSFFIGGVVVENILDLLSISEYQFGTLDRYLTSSSIGEGQKIKYLLYLLFILIMLKYDELIKVNETNKYYIALICVGICLYSMFNFNDSLSKRLCMFFFSLSIIVIPNYIKLIRIPKLYYYGICLCLFSLLIYVGSGNRRLEDMEKYSPTYPYRTILTIDKYDKDRL